MYFRGTLSSFCFQEFGETDEQKIERYLLGYRKAREAGKRYGVKVMFGVEIRLEPGVEDFLIYGIDEEFLFQNPNSLLFEPE